MMFRLSNFFGVQVCPPEVQEREPRLTVFYSPEETDKGVIITPKVLELMPDPYAALKFDDYCLNNLLRAGIQPHSIQLQSDKRIGSDKEIQAFNEHVDKLAEQIFTNI